MAKRKEVSEWLKDDQGQLDWAKEYLRGKGLLPFNAEGHLRLIGVIDGLDVEVRQRMRAAWNQHASKSKSKKKARSFALSDEAIRCLKQAAQQKHSSQTQVIEELLTDISQFKKDMRQLQEAKLKPAPSIDRLAQSQQKKTELLKRELREWEAQVDALLSVGARYRVALKAAEMLDKNLEPALNPDQAEKAARLRDRWKETITKSVKSNTALMRILSAPLDQLVEQ